jgi:hypothetical protein
MDVLQTPNDEKAVRPFHWAGPHTLPEDPSVLTIEALVDQLTANDSVAVLFPCTRTSAA